MDDQARWDKEQRESDLAERSFNEFLREHTKRELGYDPKGPPCVTPEGNLFIPWWW